MSSSATAIGVLVISDVRLYRDGLVRALEDLDCIRIVGVAAKRGEALDRVRELRPDAVIFDTAMQDGPATIREIAATAPESRVVAFAVAEDERNVLAYAEAGVAGYVPRDGSVADLVAAIERAMRGELLCSPCVAAIVFRRLASLAIRTPPQDEELSKLTPREIAIVELIDEGLSNKQIARRLFIEVATVKNHVHNILEKLRVSRRGEAAARLRATTTFGRQRTRIDARA